MIEGRSQQTQAKKHLFLFLDISFASIIFLYYSTFFLFSDSANHDVVVSYQRNFGFLTFHFLSQPFQFLSIKLDEIVCPCNIIHFQASSMK